MAKDSGTILLLGGLGVAAFGWYKGWFASFGFPGPAATPSTTITAAQLAAMQQAAAAAASGSGSSSGPSIPAVGTVVDAAGIAAQVAANDSYIVPSASAVSQAPTGYVMVGVADKSAAPAGVIYLRADIAKKNVDTANAAIDALNTAAQIQWEAQNAMNPGAFPAPTPQQPITAQTLQLKDLKSIVGLSGLGDFQRYVFTRTGRVRPVVVR